MTTNPHYIGHIVWRDLVVVWTRSKKNNWILDWFQPEHRESLRRRPLFYSSSSIDRPEIRTTTTFRTIPMTMLFTPSSLAASQTGLFFRFLSHKLLMFPSSYRASDDYTGFIIMNHTCQCLLRNKSLIKRNKRAFVWFFYCWVFWIHLPSGMKDSIFHIQGLTTHCRIFLDLTSGSMKICCILN